jgi:hypothetical protein
MPNTMTSYQGIVRHRLRTESAATQSQHRASSRALPCGRPGTQVVNKVSNADFDTESTIRPMRQARSRKIALPHVDPVCATRSAVRQRLRTAVRQSARYRAPFTCVTVRQIWHTSS